jgi:hypothetical protein
MKHRFLLHSLSHTIVAVDITEIGLPTEIYPRDGQRRVVPAVRFQSWNGAAQHLSALGADTKMLEETSVQLQKTSVAVLTIV